MPTPDFTSRCSSRQVFRFFCFLPAVLAVAPAVAKAQAQTKSEQSSSSPAKPSSPEKHPAPTKGTPEAAAQTPEVLVQLNSALEGLAAKVSPAVVQILVTGYGQLHEEDRSQTALIVRQHAVGSGVIVDR